MRACRRIANNNPIRRNTSFFLERADTPEKARIGLSKRTFLDEDKGMLFLSHDGVIAMWMKDTLIPLDMLFFNEQNRIVYIYTAKPLDLTAISVDTPVSGVIELSGGICNKLGIKSGDSILLIE